MREGEGIEMKTKAEISEEDLIECKKLLQDSEPVAFIALEQYQASVQKRDDTIEKLTEFVKKVSKHACVLNDPCFCLACEAKEILEGK